MYIVDDIAYANDTTYQDIKVVKLKVITDLCLLLTFSNGEMKIFDATVLLQYPAYQKLKDFAFFEQAYIDKGVVTWNNGEIDVAPEEMYKLGFPYETNLSD